MEALVEFAARILGVCFATAFIAELIVNRRTFFVALLVPLLTLLLLVLWDWKAISTDSSYAVFPVTIAAFGILPAIAGSGLARFIRLWIALKRDNRDPDNPDERRE